MKAKRLEICLLLVSQLILLFHPGCKEAQGDQAAEAPPPPKVVAGVDVTYFSVEHPEQYPPVTATEYQAPSELTAVGVVLPDIARSVPVITLASGRVVDIRARLGDNVQKGQVLLRVRSDDVGLGFDAYRKAVADELLARKQLMRAKDLYEHGAIAEQDLEVAQDAEDDAKVTLGTATEHLHLLGNDPDKPNGVVDLLAPISGVITDQEVTNAASVQAYSSPNPFTISDLTTVWIVCDVYENDMRNVRLGETAEIKLNAFPTRFSMAGSATLEPFSIPPFAPPRFAWKSPTRTRSCGRACLPRPPSTAWRSTPTPPYQRPRSCICTIATGSSFLKQGKFRRTEVTSGAELPNGMQEILKRAAARPAGRVQCGHHTKCH